MRELEPGPELDALIAEKVFGVIPSLNPYLNIPPFSTEITAAWNIVQKLDPWKLRIERFWVLGTIYHSAEFVNDGKSHKEKSIDSLAHAIVLASLKAVGVDNNV